MIKDHKQIAMRYFFSGFMVFDFVATIPIDKIMGDEGSNPLEFNKSNNSS